MATPAGPIEVVGFGAGAEDFYRPIGEISHDHVPGAKTSEWTWADDTLLDTLLRGGCESHIGGNAVNTLAYLAVQGSVAANVNLVTALGDERTSWAIQDGLDRVGVGVIAEQYDGYLPSVSIIERRTNGSDRMVRGRPRTPLNDYISDRQITQTTERADVVLVASLKSTELMQRVFDQIPEGTFLSCNPGSSEFAHSDELKDVMLSRRPDLLALNDEELLQFMDAHAGVDMSELAREATLYARTVLCTLGKNGVLLATRDKVLHQPAALVPGDEVVDTLGAGDRAHAITLDGLIAGHAGQLILQNVAQGTANLIKHTGAHGDLYTFTS